MEKQTARNYRSAWCFWHDGRQWKASSGTEYLEADELEDLDQKIKDSERKKHPEKAGHDRLIWLIYDNSRIPGWIKPYMPHYFDRILKMDR